MEVHATSLPLPEQESLTTASGDVGVTQSHTTHHPRQPSYACDQTWTDFFKSLSQVDHDPTQNPNMDLQYFGFDDPAQTQVGAMNDAIPSHTFNDPQSASSTGSVGSSLSFDSKDMPHAFQSQWQTLNHQPISFGGYEQAPYQQVSPWMPAHGFEPQINFGFPQDQGLGIQMPPTSNPVAMASHGFHDNFVGHHSPIDHGDGFNRQDFRPWMQQPEYSAPPPPPDMFEDDDDEEGVESTDPCYAQLLYKCLKEAPNNTLSLRELYEWVAQHSQKAKDPKNRGWQNSVRHNLSMNAAFARVQHGGAGTKKGSLWRLTDEALRDGVISTTRYRKDPKRKPERRAGATPAINRQESGAKGGRATRDATRLRNLHQHRVHGTPYSRHRRRADRHHTGPAYSPYSIHSAPNSPVGQQPFMAPMSTPQPPSHVSSPYFNVVEEQPQFGDDLTPTGFALPGQQHPLPEDLLPLDDPTKPSSVTNFDFLPLDLSQAPLFGDYDPELGLQNPHTPTPSLMTEESFMAEDNVPPLMSCDTSRETSTFQ